MTERTLTPDQKRAKYATIAKRKKLAAAQPNHRAGIIDAMPRDDRPPLWHVVCADCTHEWRKTNAMDHGEFTLDEARAFVKIHNQIRRYVYGEKGTHENR